MGRIEKVVKASSKAERAVNSLLCKMTAKKVARPVLCVCMCANYLRYATVTSGICSDSLVTVTSVQIVGKHLSWTYS